MPIKHYDFHVATDAGGESNDLRAKLRGIGLVDDRLVHRGLVFGARTASFYSSCPLIDVHMSKGVQRRAVLRAIEHQVDAWVRESGCAGYWHSEFIEWDATIASGGVLNLSASCPFGVLRPEPRAQHKKWDLHVTFFNAELSTELRERLIAQGLYYLVRRKAKGDAAVLTIQGVNAVQEGRQLAQALLWWLVRIGVPRFDFKFEVTTSMGVVNNPRLTPPTIDHVLWR